MLALRQADDSLQTEDGVNLKQEIVRFRRKSPRCAKCGCDVCGCTAERRAMRDNPLKIVGIDWGREPALTHKHIPLSEILRTPIDTPETALTLEKLKRISERWREEHAAHVERHVNDALLYGMGVYRVSRP